MACSGWQQVGSGMYYFLSDGTMKQDWLLLNGSDWYYLGKDGARKTGLVILDSNSFYFYVENDSNGGSVGLMAANRTITLGSKTLYIDGVDIFIVVIFQIFHIYLKSIIDGGILQLDIQQLEVLVVFLLQRQ